MSLRRLLLFATVCVTPRPCPLCPILPLVWPHGWAWEKRAVAPCIGVLALVGKRHPEGANAVHLCTSSVSCRGGSGLFESWFYPQPDEMLFVFLHQGPVEQVTSWAGLGRILSKIFKYKYEYFSFPWIWIQIHQFQKYSNMNTFLKVFEYIYWYFWFTSYLTTIHFSSKIWIFNVINITYPKVYFFKGHFSGLNILYLTKIAIILEIFVMGLVLSL